MCLLCPPCSVSSCGCVKLRCRPWLIAAPVIVSLTLVWRLPCSLCPCLWRPHENPANGHLMDRDSYVVVLALLGSLRFRINLRMVSSTMGVIFGIPFCGILTPAFLGVTALRRFFGGSPMGHPHVCGGKRGSVSDRVACPRGYGGRVGRHYGGDLCPLGGCSF